MITATYKNQHGTNTVKVDHLVNRGEWFGETYLIEVGIGYTSASFVVEADHEGAALDTFADSRYSHLIDSDEICDYCEAENYDYCECTFMGNDSHRVNLDYVAIHKCKVNYFAKPE